MIKELHISVGLPGSGKSTLFKEIFDGLDRDKKRKSMLIKCDDYLVGSRPTYKNMSDLLKDRSRLFCEYTYLDGLFLTSDHIVSVINELSKKGYLADIVDKIIIHYWKPDIEACEWNDEGRRSTDSNITIKNAKIDSLEDLSKLSIQFKAVDFEFITHNVEKKPNWKHFADVNGLYADEHGNVRGDSWSLGGTWGDCWGGGGTVSPSTAPEGMCELDELLEKIAPNISFLTYKKIMNECVTIKDYSEGDYYGGSVYYNQYILNVPSLYKFLQERQLIN